MKKKEDIKNISKKNKNSMKNAKKYNNNTNKIKEKFQKDENTKNNENKENKEKNWKKRSTYTYKDPDVSLIDYIIRILIVWVGELLGFILIANMNIGLTVDSWVTALIVVIILGIINALLWPILTRILLPFLVFTFGVGSLLLNVLLFWIVAYIVPGITISGNAIIIAPFIMSIINTSLSIFLTLNDDTTYYRYVIRRGLREGGKKSKKPPGTIILEIDGLAKDILEEAIEKGHMPTLKKIKLLGNYKIQEWETDLSSQTSASQAGILHGNNENIVAYRWVEKENNNKIRVSTGITDAPLIERRVSDGKGLLMKNGASRSNLFSGDTNDVVFTYSKLITMKNFFNSIWSYVYSNPSNFGRILLLSVEDIVREFISQLKHWIKNIKPRMRRSFQYAFIRSVANIFMREITTQIIIGDMLRGNVDIVYSTYIGYDEIAHHSGIRDEDAFYALKGIDNQIKRLMNTNGYSERKYKFVIQSDHGQSNGNTFKQRYGLTLKDLVYSLLPENMEVYSELYSNEDNFSQVITFPIEHVKGKVKEKTKFARDIYKNMQKKIDVKKEDVLEYVTRYPISKKKDKKTKKNLKNAQVIILASGNLGLIYLTQWKEKLTYEKIKAMFPELIPGLVQHDGIGFILINSDVYGAIAIGKEGIHYLEKENDNIEGKDPLKNFGENAAKHLLRTSKFKYTPDILVNSLYETEKDEIAAFEELIGSHGGMGGTQTKPFIMHPSDWNIDDEKIIGAEQLHEVLKSEILDN